LIAAYYQRGCCITSTATTSSVRHRRTECPGRISATTESVFFPSHLIDNMGLLPLSAPRSPAPWLILTRTLATVTERRRHVPQTVIEKIVQKHAVGLPLGKVVKAGDYVMIRPEHVMTHDNTGPVISKFVAFATFFLAPPFRVVALSDRDLGSNLLGQRDSNYPHKPFSPLITTFRTNLPRIWLNMQTSKRSRGHMESTFTPLAVASVIKSWWRKVTPFLIHSPSRRTVIVTCTEALGVLGRRLYEQTRPLFGQPELRGGKYPEWFVWSSGEGLLLGLQVKT
jgi:hypothetical protein